MWTGGDLIPRLWGAPRSLPRARRAFVPTELPAQQIRLDCFLCIRILSGRYFGVFRAGEERLIGPRNGIIGITGPCRRVVAASCGQSRDTSRLGIADEFFQAKGRRIGHPRRCYPHRDKRLDLMRARESEERRV